jgi:signal transduction histidine kinase
VQSSSLILGDSIDPALLSNDDPIGCAIEAAKVVTLCAQHQKVRHRTVQLEAEPETNFFQRIVDDVLVLSKVDANLVEIHPIDVQPQVLVPTMVKMFTAELLANNSCMSFEFERSLKDLCIDWVRMDSSRLLQVLINLCTNAVRLVGNLLELKLAYSQQVKFTAESEIREILITLGASTTPPSDSTYGVQYVHHQSDEAIIDPTTKHEWGQGETIYLQFQVTDTGRGMTQEELKPLFQRFSQASPKTHTRMFGISACL